MLYKTNFGWALTLRKKFDKWDWAKHKRWIKNHTHTQNEKKRISHFLDLWIIIPIRGDVYEQFFWTMQSYFVHFEQQLMLTTRAHLSEPKKGSSQGLPLRNPGHTPNVFFSQCHTESLEQAAWFFFSYFSCLWVL